METKRDPLSDLLGPDEGDPAAAGNAPALSVGDLSREIKRTLEGDFGHVRVQGEISGAKRAGSGHWYFRLKDDTAVIDAVLWRGQAGKLKTLPEDGLEVVATGRVTTYPGRSVYQIVVERIEPAGMGALLKLLEARRKALEAEGLFVPGRKRPLPYLPGVIGVVTSPTGAVIRDILHRLADRFPRRVLVWPIRVQGERAAEEAAAAIQGFIRLSPDGRTPRPDVLIVARGGGSQPNGVTDAEFADLLTHFSEQGALEIVAVIALFGFLNRWNDTLATQLEEAPMAAAKSLQAGNWDGGTHPRSG